MDDDDVHESEDDALEETRPDDMFHPDSDEEKLADDFAAPAAPLSSDDNLQTSPLTDDNPDEDEVYSEGLAAATGLDDAEEDSDDAPAEPLEPEN
jgi:hypothetical protein